MGRINQVSEPDRWTGADRRRRVRPSVKTERLTSERQVVLPIREQAAPRLAAMPVSLAGSGLRSCPDAVARA